MDKLGALLPGSKILQFARMYRQNLQKNISEQLGQNRDSSFRKPIFIISTKLSTKLVKQSPGNNWDELGTLLPGSKFLQFARMYQQDLRKNISEQLSQNEDSLFRNQNFIISTKLATQLVKQPPRNNWHQTVTLLPGSNFLQIARMYLQASSEQVGQNRGSLFRKQICTIFTKLTTELAKQSPRNTWDNIGTLLPDSNFFNLHKGIDNTDGKTSQNNWDTIGTVCLENQVSLFPQN